MHLLRNNSQLEAKRSEEYMEESAVFRRQSSTASDEEDLHHAGSTGPEEIIHIQKDLGLGGNVCAKIVFFCLLGALGVMVGLIITEYRGSSEVDTQSALDSPWSLWLDGWIDDSPSHSEAEDVGEIDDDHGKDMPEKQEPNETEVEGDIIPEIVRRQTLVPPPEEFPPPDQESDYSEDEEDEEEEEVEEELVQKTYEDLKAKYLQQTPEDSDVEPTEEDFITKAPETYDYSPTPPESEPEDPTESDVDEDEEEEEEDKGPLAEWKNRGPALLAEEVEDVQTESESEDEPLPPSSSSVRRGGPVGIDEQIYENADITNEADFAIKEELDFADADYNDQDFTN